MSKKKAELVVISDIHLHPWSAFAAESGIDNTRFHQTLRVLENSLVLARERKATWICAGDFVHTISYCSNFVLNHLIYVLASYDDVAKYVIWGNHDSRGRGGIVHPLESVTSALHRAVPNLQVGELYKTVEGLTIFGQGAQPQPVHRRFDRADVGVFHFMVEGSETASGYNLPGMDPHVLDDYPLAIVGDVHQPQLAIGNDVIRDYFRMDQGASSHHSPFPDHLIQLHELEMGDWPWVLLVPGSPEQHNFGDAGPHGYWHVILEEDDRWQVQSLQLIESDSPQFLTVATAEEVLEDGNFYRVTTPTAKEDLPENAIALTSPPATVQTRDAVGTHSSIEAILKFWMKENPPEDEEGYLDAGIAALRASGEMVEPVAARVDQIRATNFLSYQSLNFNFKEGVHLVVGESRDFTSNGAGKSTIFEALYWCLFGQTTKDVRDLILWGAPEAEVWVDIEIPHTDPTLQPATLNLMRTKTSDGTKFKAILGGSTIANTGVRDLTQKVSALLGITPNLFRALAYYSQEKVLLFSAATDAERKTILGELLGLHAYQTAAANLAQVAAKLTSEIAIQRAWVRDWGEHLDSVADNLSGLRVESTKWEESRQGYISTAESTKAVVQEKVLSLNEQKERLDRIVLRGALLLTLWKERRRAGVDGLMENFVAPVLPEPKWAASESYDVASRTVVIALPAAMKRRDELLPVEEQLSDNWNRLTELKVLSDAAAAEVAWVDKLAGGEVCTTCRQEIDKSQLEEMRVRYAKSLAVVEEDVRGVLKVREGLAETQNELTEVRKDIAAMERLADLVRHHDSEKRRISEANDALQASAFSSAYQQAEQTAELKSAVDHQRISGYLSAQGKRITNAFDAASQRMQAEEAIVQTWQDAVNPLEESRLKAESELVALTEKVEVGDKVVKNLLEERDRAEYWSNGFGKQGIQSLLVDEIAAVFNQYRGSIFPMLTRGVYDVQFSTQSQTQAGEVREKTEFVITQHGLPVAYNNLSGGQRRRIDIGVLLTLSLAVSQTRQIPGLLGLLVFDEVFDFLDADGAEALYEVLREVQATIPHIYVITQDTEMQSQYPSVVAVVQDDNGWSQVV